MTLRKIAPMLLPDTVRAIVDGPKPELHWVAPTELLVDGSYQRELSPQSVRLIRTIVKEFAWTRIKPPVAVRVEKGFHVIDGQHTAIAAASLGLAEIPIFVVAAPQIIERAQAFVSHNRNRLMITALDIHRALVAGGDPLAASVQKACDDLGVRFRYISHSSRAEVGDTQCISRVIGLFRTHGATQARAVLQVLVNAKCAPLTESHITAARQLLAEAIPAKRLIMAIRIGRDDDLIQARARAATDGVRTWQALKTIWEKRLKP